MARPVKKGFDYFPFDVDFFRNIVIRITLVRYGTGGVLLYIYLLTRVYSEGYYMEYNDDMVDVAADELMMEPDRIREIISFFCKKSLFDSRLFAEEGIITSEGIQSRFQHMVKERALKRPDRCVSAERKYWLLEEEETESFIKLRPSKSSPEKNDSYSGEKCIKESKENKSKEKESKAKESKVCMSLPCKNGSYDITEEILGELTHTYPDMDGLSSLNKLNSYLTANPHKQGFVSSVKGYVNMWLSEDYQKGRYRAKQPDTYQGTYDIAEYESSSICDGFTLREQEA